MVKWNTFLLLYCPGLFLSPSPIPQSLPLCLTLFQCYGIGFLISFYGVWSGCSWLAASKHIALGKVTASKLTPDCCWVGRLMLQLFAGLTLLSPPLYKALLLSPCLSLLSLYLGDTCLSQGVALGWGYSALTDMSVALLCLLNITFVFGSVLI